MELNIIRSLAGIPAKSILAEKNGHFEPIEKEEPAAVADEPTSKKDKDDKPEYSEIVVALSAKVEGKTGDDLLTMVDNIYSAGVKDGITQAKAKEEVTKVQRTKDDE